MRIYLNVPYSEKECAKSFGARWDGERKLWCVPDGVMLARFERWLPSAADGGALIQAAKTTKSSKKPRSAGKPRVDGYVGKTTVGSRYFDTGHDCNPLEACASCRPALLASGWLDGENTPAGGAYLSQINNAE